MFNATRIRFTTLLRLTALAGILLTVRADAGITFFVDGTCGNDAWGGQGPSCVALFLEQRPKKTIQAAIDAAPSQDALILVVAGTYQETIDFNGKNVTVQSFSGAEQTVIDATGLGDTAVKCLNGESPVLIGFTVTGGSATEFLVGGGMDILNGSPTVITCIFDGNSARSGAGMLSVEASPTIVDCTFQNNVAQDHGGGLYLVGCNATVHGCTFSGNTADVGGGIQTHNTSDVTETSHITGCTIVDNDANISGGAMSGSGSPLISNCILADNSAITGGAIRVYFGDYVVMNCVLYGNATSSTGAAIRVFSNSTLNATNSIVWSNVGDGDDIQVSSDAQAIVSYCNIEGGFSGPGNISTNPMFVDAGAGDFNLQPSSPCIDAGDTVATAGAAIELDIAGLDRAVNDPATADTGISVWGHAVDIGPYEHQVAPAPLCPGDVDGDGTVDAQDLAQLLGNWGSCK